MIRKFIFSFFFISAFYSSYSQLIDYKDLVGFTYSIKNASKPNQVEQIEFKDSFHIVLTDDGDVRNLTYKLDGQYGITTVAMKDPNAIIYAPGTANGGGLNRMFFLVKKANGFNLKIQGLSPNKLTGWDEPETDENTFLMIPLNTGSHPR